MISIPISVFKVENGWVIVGLVFLMQTLGVDLLHIRRERRRHDADSTE